MSIGTFITQARDTIAPPAANPHGPLPPLLLLWTVVTGLVDAYSYLELNRVFVANMTGNVVFLGFSLAGAPDFLWWASLLAIFAFMLGANIGGRIQRHRSHNHRGRFLAYAAGTQLLLVLLSIATALILPPDIRLAGLVVLVIVLSVAMGLQNSAARALGVPDLTTTVLTLTITGLAGDGSAESGKKNNIGRRVLSISAMALGAFIGGVLVQQGASPWALVVAAVLLAIIAAKAYLTRTSSAKWVSPKA